MEDRYLVLRMFLIIVTILPIALFTSCTTSFQDRQIKNIPGEWEVFEVTTDFVNFEPFKPPIEESGELGFFEFTKSTVTYNFIRNDSLFTGSGPYSIDRNRAPQKIIFTFKEDFLLLPPDDKPHSLIFNKTDDGVIMILNFRPQDPEPAIGYTLVLRKID
ncbi:MAG: hypothetical protein GVY20_01125 [Bacteroidetes bacterium]|jgi:hypothetical protein|nr:hypothetical protein [Bacteroidota bacterium]